MLNFKFGKFYKDTEGREWEYCGYTIGDLLLYNFRRGICDCTSPFFEQEINTVIFNCAGHEIKIPFVEEKERDWVIGEEYECFHAVTQRVIKARLAKIIKETDSHLIYVFNIDGIHFSFHYEGIVLIMGRFAIFKDGIPQELKDRINKGKLTNKRKCFQKGKIYKTRNGDNWKFIKRAKVKSGLVAMFECESNSYLDIKALLSIKGVECIKAGDKVNLCTDESIRNEDVSKAVRVMQ